MVEKVVSLKEAFDIKLREQWVSNDTKNAVRRKRFEKGENKTGFYNVTKIYCQSCKKKFTYRYIYVNENGKKKLITSVDFDVLRKRVKDMGFKWKVENYYMARKTAEEVGLPLFDLK